MAVGLMEAFYLFERYAKKALTVDEILFMASAKKKRGCRMLKSELTTGDVKEIIRIGLKIKKWKDESR